MNKNKKGAILPLVWLLFIALTFIFSALLHSTGVLLSRVTHFESRLQVQYNAESAILLKLYHVRFSNSKNSFPNVLTDTLGPWLVLKTQAGEREVFAYAGFYTSKNNPPFSHQDLLQAESRCLLYYQERWQSESYKDTLYGNTYFYNPKKDDFLGTFYVALGDLKIDLQKKRFSKIAFYVEGNVLIEGEGIIDSLHLFSTGSISLSGLIKINEASLYARGTIEISDPVEARGVFLSEDTVLVSEKTFGIPFWSNAARTIESQDSLFLPIDLANQNPLRIFSWAIK